MVTRYVEMYTWKYICTCTGNGSVFFVVFLVLERAQTIERTVPNDTCNQ